MDINNLEPNSHKYRQEKMLEKKQDVPEKKQIEKAAIGEVSIKKRGLLRRFLDDFFTGNIRDVRQYLIFDVLFPSIKETINNMVNKGTEMILFGEASRSADKRKLSSGTTYVSYGSSYRNEKERLPSARNRLAMAFDDIEFQSRGDAEIILNNLAELMERYHQVTIGDFYDAVGITPNWSEIGNADSYGWNDISGVHITRTRTGYVLQMPKCIRLD